MRTRESRPSTIAKLLYTSGSTGRPKGVINTQQMLCSNQEMLRTVLPLLAEEPPVLCDWLPWNHTFGGNHNFGLVLFNGGTLYIDAGKPTPAAFDTTVAQPARDCDHRVLQRAARIRSAGSASSRRSRVLPPLLQPAEDAVLRRRLAASADRRRPDRAGDQRVRRAYSVCDRPRRDRECAVRALRRRCRFHRWPNRRAGARCRAEGGASRAARWKAGCVDRTSRPATGRTRR